MQKNDNQIKNLSAPLLATSAKSSWWSFMSLLSLLATRVKSSWWSFMSLLSLLDMPSQDNDPNHTRSHFTDDGKFPLVKSFLTRMSTFILTLLLSIESSILDRIQNSRVGIYIGENIITLHRSRSFKERVLVYIYNLYLVFFPAFLTIVQLMQFLCQVISLFRNGQHFWSDFDYYFSCDTPIFWYGVISVGVLDLLFMLSYQFLHLVTTNQFTRDQGKYVLYFIYQFYLLCLQFVCINWLYTSKTCSSTNPFLFYAVIGNVLTILSQICFVNLHQPLLSMSIYYYDEQEQDNSHEYDVLM